MRRSFHFRFLGFHSRRRGQQDVRVRPAETEGANSGKAFRLRVPGCQCCGNSHWQLGPRNVGVEVLQMQVRRNLSVLQHQDDLDQTSNARG